MGQGLNKDGLERFAAVAASHVGDDEVPGLVALVAHGDDVHVEALGTLTVGKRPVERASLFRIASTTKPTRGEARVRRTTNGPSSQSRIAAASETVIGRPATASSAPASEPAPRRRTVSSCARPPAAAVWI